MSTFETAEPNIAQKSAVPRSRAAKREKGKEANMKTGHLGRREMLKVASAGVVAGTAT
jgi:hypothetical protein